MIADFKVVKKNASFLLKLRKINNKNLSSFSRAMKNNMKAGIPIVTSLSLIEKQYKKGILKKEIYKLILGISGGKTLKEAFEEEGTGFPAFYKTMMYIGEESGRLQDIFQFLEDYYLKEYKRRKKIINISIYPIAVLSLGIIMGVLIIAKVLPQFFSMLLVNNKELPKITKFYMGISKIVNNLGVLLIPLIIVFILIIIKGFNKLKEKEAFQKVIYKIPLVNSFLLKKFTCRFTLSFFIMLSSGVDFKSSFEILSNCEKAYLGARLNIVKEELSKGNTIYEAMKKAGIFQEYLLNSIYMGEVNGSLEEMLKITNEVMEEEFNLDLERLINLMEPSLMIIVGGFVLSIVLSIMLPLFSIYDLKL